MILAILFLFFAAGLGLMIVEKIKIDLFAAEKIVWALILGWISSAYAVLLASFVIGVRNAALLVLAAMFLLLLCNYYRGKKTAMDLSFEKKRADFLFLILCAFLFFILLYGTLWTAKNGAMYLASIGVWADWAMHLSLVNFFAGQPVFSPGANPLFYGLPLAYTFFADFFSAILVSLGTTAYFSFIVLGIAMSVAIAVLIFFLSYRLTKNIGASLAVPFLFFANGGWAFSYILEDLEKANWDIVYFLSNIPREYAHFYELGHQWGNVLIFFFMPQRAFLLGLPLGIIILTLILNKKFRWAGIFLGLAAPIHTHTFISLFIVAPFLIFYIGKKESVSFGAILKKGLAEFFVPAIVLAAPFLFWVALNTHGIRENSFFSFHPGWVTGKENWTWLWFEYVGLLLPLIPIALFSKKAGPLIKFFYLPFLLLFVLGNIFSFQPNLADNNKIFVWWFLLSLILISGFLFEWAKKSFFKKCAVGVIFFSLTFAGALNIVWVFEPQSHFIFLSKEELALAKYVNENTPRESLILTSDRHNHPVSTFSGRRILMGYRGWLWTWGIDYREREKEVVKMFQGDKNLLGSFGVDYVVIGPSEREKFPVNEKFFKDNYPLIFQSENYEIYDTRL